MLKIDTSFSLFLAAKYLPKEDRITYYKDDKKIYISTYVSETPELHDFIQG